MTENIRPAGVLNDTWTVFISNHPQLELTPEQKQILDMIDEYSTNAASLGNSFLVKTYLLKVIPLIESLEKSFVG